MISTERGERRKEKKHYFKVKKYINKFLYASLKFKESRAIFEFRSEIGVLAYVGSYLTL